MTAPTVSETWAAEVDIDAVLAALRARFPRVMIWHGEYTGSLWGAWRDRFGRVHMVEAADPGELGRLLAAGVRPVPLPRQDPQPVPVCVRLHGRHEAPRPPWWRRLAGAFVTAT